MGMHLLAETPLEALVFRHAAASAGASVWTWLAVLAAALGLWRIRSAAAAPRPEPSLRSGSHAAPPRGESGHSLPQPKVSRQQRQTARPEGPAVDGGDVGFTPKGTVFELRGCHVEERDDEDGVEEWDVLKEEECTWNGGGGAVTGGCVDCRWRGDLGWYRYQDMAALNGRVVRLWEDEKVVAALLGGRRPQVAW